jgi:putative transposase
MLKVVQEGLEANDGGSSVLDEIVRGGARQMLAAALRAEVAAYVEAHVGEVDDQGRRLVVRNGYHAEREVTTAAGAVEVRQPRVNDRRTDPVTGERRRFSSAILPAWSRKSPRVAEVLPLLYLHGLSSLDFGPALEQFLGSDAGLSAATITRLTAQWQDEARAFSARSLAGSDYVYIWVDGIHLKVRLEADKVCLLVIIGVRTDGRKELVALVDGFRESAESWADLLRDCRRRGMRAPVLAVGDGALGFWKAVRDVFPETAEQRCWWHRARKVLSCSFVSQCWMIWYAHRRWGSGRACGQVRGVVASSERAAAAVGVSHRGPAVGTWRGSGGRGGSRGQRDHGASGGGRAGGR